MSDLIRYCGELHTEKIGWLTQIFLIIFILDSVTSMDYRNRRRVMVIISILDRNKLLNHLNKHIADVRVYWKVSSIMIRIVIDDIYLSIGY